MSLAGVVEERNRCSENLCWGIWCSQGVREGFLGKGKREKVWVWINWGRERGRRILGRGRNMQCVIPSPVVRGSQASAVEVRARRWGRISNANFKFVFVPVPSGNSWKLSVFFLFVFTVFLMLFLRWLVLHHICALKTLLWVPYGEWTGCGGAVPVTVEHLSGGDCSAAGTGVNSWDQRGVNALDRDWGDKVSRFGRGWDIRRYIKDDSWFAGVCKWVDDVAGHRGFGWEAGREWKSWVQLEICLKCSRRDVKNVVGFYRFGTWKAFWYGDVNLSCQRKVGHEVTSVTLIN